MINRQILFFSLVSIIIGTLLWRAGNKILKKGKRSMAKIIYNTYKPDIDGEGGGIYYPTINFLTDKNESVTVELSIGTLPKRSVGTTIEVVYNPNDPHDFDTSPGLFLVVLPKVLVAAGLTGLIVSTLEMFNVIPIIPE